MEILSSDLLFWGSLPWVIFIVALLIIDHQHSSDDTKLKNLFWLVFIFSALRYGIGYDYYSYKDIISGVAPEYALDRWEILPRSLADLCRPYHYQLFFVITSFIINYSLYYVVKNLSTDKVMSYLIFVLYPQFFLISLGPIRNCVAYALVMVMFYLWYDNKKLYSLIAYALAIGFHTSAVFSAILLLLPYFLKDRKSNVLLYAFSLVGSVAFLPIMNYFFAGNAQVEYYLLHAENFSGGALYRIIVNLVAILNLIYWNKLVDTNSTNRYYQVIVNIGALIYNLTIGVSPVFATRLFSYCWYFLILLLPSYPIATNFKISRKMILSFCAALFVFTFLMQYRNFVNEGIRMSNIPYQLFFYHTDYFYNMY